MRSQMLGVLVQLLVVTGALGVTGCATPAPISANIVQDVLKEAPVKPTGFFSIDVGLKEMAANLDGALSVGLTDPRIVAMDKCVHGVNTQLGFEGTPAPTFTPQTTTFLGLASVAFIRAVQVATLQGGGVSVPMECKTELGQMVLDGAAASAKGLSGGLAIPFR